VGAARFALSPDIAILPPGLLAGVKVGPASQGVLIMNPKSGGGKAQRFGLIEQARRRHIKPIVLQPGDDLRQLCEDAVTGGADVIGIAGGDGSQALAASVAIEHDVALVCIPAGTRNHFALDLGLDRDDVVGALDAFGEAVERHIDLARVGTRVFVNNVSLGVYAKIVQSSEYRAAKRQTVDRMLPDLLGPNAQPLDLEFTGPDGEPNRAAQLIQVSNNPYLLSRLGGFGTRPRLDTGHLGVAAASIRGASDLAELVTLEACGQIRHFGGWIEWETPSFQVWSSRTIEAGVDGEALTLQPPLQFTALPAALRVRIPPSAPGLSPSAKRFPSSRWALTALVNRAAGRPVPPLPDGTARPLTS
jgi:diacylglycerol kinase family enzyme